MPVQSTSRREILSALSVALDLVEGQPEGHAVRTAWLASKIANRLGLGEETISQLHFAALIKDAGCSNNSARIQAIFGGDELSLKRAVKLIDWTSSIESIRFAAKQTEVGGALGAKIRRMARNLGNPRTLMNEVTMARCGRGAEIALELGFDPVVAHAVMNLDEHWDGNGSPSGRKGEEIPVLSRILCLAQTLEVFASAFGSACAVEMVRKRSGSWFDPQIAPAAISFENDDALWIEHAHMLESGSIEFQCLEFENKDLPADIDRICSAFAKIVDAKSTYTGEHSTRVTHYACAIAKRLQLPTERRACLRRAALLHDIGKLGIPNCVLEKPSSLTESEFALVKLHPANSERIIASIRGLAREAEIAGAHHERLDGTGYPHGRSAENLDQEMRILAAADVFDALCAKRPYRDSLPAKEALSVMEESAGRHLDPTMIEVLRCEFEGHDSLAA